MVEEGVSIIDIGAESTRPGSEPVSTVEQLKRVIPVIDGLRSTLKPDVHLSIDSRDPEVAERAVVAGANMINDISGGGNSEMLSLAAAHRIPIVLMHMQGSPQSMQNEPKYVDVVGEIGEFLITRAEQAKAAGVLTNNIIVDPGIGFGKTKIHNLEILRHLQEFVALGYPVMLGTSRKRFMGAICQEDRIQRTRRCNLRHYCDRGSCWDKNISPFTMYAKTVRRWKSRSQLWVSDLQRTRLPALLNFSYCEK